MELFEEQEFHHLPYMDGVSYTLGREYRVMR